MAQRLVDRRKAAGLSQEALAAQLGVSRQAVSKWERSESSPDTDNLIALAALYGVSLDELLYGEAANDADDLEDGSADTETARRFPAGRKHTTRSTIMASISAPRSDVHGTNSPSPHLSLSPIWCSALSTAHGPRDSSSSFWFPSTTRLVTLSIDAICQSSLNASIQQPPSLGSSTCGSVWDSPILHGSSSLRFPS